MKVMQELVAHFDRQRRLTTAQIRRLLDQGFLASDAPMHMLGLVDTVGATYYFRVTGTTEGPLWGTDTYTGDSNIATAVVHAGLLQAGEPGIVKVTVVPALGSYAGSVRHGVTSHEFGRYGSAYTVARV